MIQEQYVTFEVAKLLKEKVFNEEVRTYYDEFGKEHDLSDDFSDIKNTDIDAYPEFVDSLDFHCTRPTQQMAMRWLREIHNLYIEIQIDYRQETNYKALWFASILKFCSSGNIRKGNVQNKLSYESAAEAAIKYCLENLI